MPCESALDCIRFIVLRINKFPIWVKDFFMNLFWRQTKPFIFEDLPHLLKTTIYDFDFLNTIPSVWFSWINWFLISSSCFFLRRESFSRWQYQMGTTDTSGHLHTNWIHIGYRPLQIDGCKAGMVRIGT